MRCSTSQSLFIAVIFISEALCGPTIAHKHRNAHQKKDLKNVDWKSLDWNNMGIDWAAAYAKGHPNAATTPSEVAPPPDKLAPAPAPAPAPETKPAETPKPATLEGPSNPPSSGTGVSPVSDATKSKPGSGSSAALWKNLVGASNNRKSFGLSTPTRGHEVGYLSNVGIPEGSNMIKVASAQSNPFTNEFINTSKKSMTVVIWNKAASPGLKDPLNADPNLGASIAPENPALTLALAPGESQVVAFLDESVIGWAEATDARAMSGGFSTTWGEAQFNTTGSGYDVSAIQNPSGSTYLMEISSTEANSCDSTETENMWITDTKTTGSGSCFIAQSVAHLTTRMGGFIS
ncbi:hypothetical protein K3495_g4770 [Podosphaera aphanis]|nr:hypothetical protein K3495_g4770 [Podosphaera aphanis]